MSRPSSDMANVLESADAKEKNQCEERRSLYVCSLIFASEAGASLGGLFYASIEVTTSLYGVEM